ncbi:hypothetical protein [Streptomyces sioyaensis]|uniref:hypothetical protein n=1 Tax=Streptomyces sioyaensis TaxID=67364 RepID=UPI003D73360A
MGNVSKGVGVIGNRNYVGRTKYAQAKYDFAVHGGAQGAITLTGDTVPSGAIVTDCFIVLDTVVTSGGTPTISIGIEGAADIRAAASFASAPALNATTGAKRSAILTATTTPLVVTTADRQVTITVGTADLTAGVFRVVLAYVEVAA